MGESQAGKGDVLWYVYGVQRAETVSPAAHGVDAQPVRTVIAGPLAALVSVVSRELFQEDADPPQDITWLGNQAFAHESVLAAAFSAGPVLPLRFGAVYESEEAVRRFLGDHSHGLLHELSRLDGHSEWSVKVLADRRVQQRTLQDASRASAKPAASEGHAFFERRRSERLLEEHRQRVTAQVALDTHERLTAIAQDALTARPQDPALSGYDGEMALNGVYLVDAASLPAFQSEVAALQTERAGAGFSLVVTGPWPPHHFIKVRAVESPVASEAGA